MKKKLFEKLVNDFNSYSELVAFNNSKGKECEESTLQWNRGILKRNG